MKDATMEETVTDTMLETVTETMTETVTGEETVDLGASLGAGYQLGFLLLAAAAAVPPVRLVRALRAAGRPLSAVDETLLARALLTCVTAPLYNGCLLLVSGTHSWGTPTALRTAACWLYSLVIVDGVGLVSAANCVISLSRLQQVVVATRWPALAPLLTQRRLRWQNRLLLAALLVTFSALPALGLQPTVFFWCAGRPLPRHRPPVLVLFAVNSAINCTTFAACAWLLRASSGLPDTARPRNFVSAHGWAQHCLVLVVTSTLLVPGNISQLAPQPRIFLNHALVTFIYSVLDSCLLLTLAGRWRRQAARCRRRQARTRSPRAIPTIKLHLI